MLQQILQQQKFLGRQPHVAAAVRHRVALDVDADRPAAQDALLDPARGRPAQQCAHARHQLVRAEWLDDVVVGAQVEAENALGLFATRRQHDDGERRRAVVGPKRLADVEAVQAWQHQIKDDEIGRRFPRHRQRASAIGDDFRAVTRSYPGNAR